MTAMAGGEAELELLGKSSGGDSKDLYNIERLLADDADPNQVVAVATGEDPARRIQESDPTAAVPAVDVRLTTKPGAAPAKGAWRPRDRDALRYGWSVLMLPTP
jgi:hypothetical protein